MVLRPTEIHMFEYLRSRFKWIPWELPFQWNFNYTHVDAANSEWKCLPFYINTIVTFATGVLGMLVIIFRPYLFIQVGIAQVVMLGIVFALTSLITMFIVTTIVSDSLFYGLNELLGVCDRTLHGMGNRVRRNLVDKVLQIYMWIIPLVPFAIPTACIASGVDAIYVVLDTFVLPDMFYRSVAVSATQTVLRYIYYAIVSADIARGFGLILVTMLIAFNRLLALQKHFQRRWLSSHRFVKDYKQSYIAAVSILRSISQISQSQNHKRISFIRRHLRRIYLSEGSEEYVDKERLH